MHLTQTTAIFLQYQACLGCHSCYHHNITTDCARMPCFPFLGTSQCFLLSFTTLSSLFTARGTTLQDTLTSASLWLSVQNAARLTSCARYGYVFTGSEHTGRETVVEELIASNRGKNCLYRLSMSTSSNHHAKYFFKENYNL